MKSEGFSLIELLIVVSIAALLMALAVPGYRQYIQRANRSDATTALLRIASAQEKFYLVNDSGYASNNAALAAPHPNGLGIEGTERDHYDLSLTSTEPSVNFIASATPKAGGDQVDDTDCWRFEIDARGVRRAFDQNDIPNDEVCWR